MTDTTKNATSLTGGKNWRKGNKTDTFLDSSEDARYKKYEDRHRVTRRQREILFRYSKSFPVSIVHVLFKTCHNYSRKYLMCKGEQLENTSVPKIFSIFVFLLRYV